MNAVSLFSGIGGFDLGLERAGHRVVAQCEIDLFCQRVLAERWPGVTRYGDVRRVGAGMVGSAGDNAPGRGRESSFAPEHIDLLVGGFPCQDLSVAGKRAGLVGARSGLFWEIVRIAQALQPTWGLFENVPGLLSSHGGRDMAAVLEGLRQCWPVVGYRVLDSQHFGVAQRRRRVFFVGGPTEAGVAEVLALTEGGGGHSTAGGEAGTDVAYALAASVRGTGDGHGNAWNSTYIASPLSAGSHDASHMPGRRREDDVNLVLAVAEGAHPPPLVSGLLAKSNGGWRMGADEAAGGMLTVQPIVLRDERGREQGDRTLVDQTYSLHAAKGMSEQQIVTHAFSAEGHDASEDGRFSVVGHSLVRRLTPVECEKLQALPPGWTCLCTPLDAYAADEDAAALACTCPDSPRYRALGNAVTVSVIHWLGRRLMGVSAL